MKWLLLKNKKEYTLIERMSYEMDNSDYTARGHQIDINCPRGKAWYFEYSYPDPDSFEYDADYVTDKSKLNVVVASSDLDDIIEYIIKKDKTQLIKIFNQAEEALKSYFTWQKYFNNISKEEEQLYKDNKDKNNQREPKHYVLVSGKLVNKR